MPISSNDKRFCSSVYSLSIMNDRPHQPGLRALEGIKDKLQLLSEQFGTSEDAEKEGDMTATCDLADDLRDVIVRYSKAHSGRSTYDAVYSSRSGRQSTSRTVD